MEDSTQILVRQKEIIQLIKTIQINFSKDSASRKTKEYIQKRVGTLDNLFQEFNMNHEELMLWPDQTGDYFTKNIFEDTKKVYNDIRNTLMTYPTGGGVSAASTAPGEELLNEQRSNFRAFQRLLNTINIEELIEKWEMEDELRNLQMRWNNIDSLHLKIDNVLLGSNLEYEDQYSEYEKKFKMTKRKLNQKISSTAHQYESTPHMEIPTFSGDFTQWPTFLDLYKNSIHDNPRLTKGQKMQHLKGKLRGEAHRLVQHLHVSSENYDTAWEILNRRYDNKQILFTKQIEIFLNQPVIQKQSSVDLQRLHDITMESIYAIHNLGVDTTTWDPLLVHLLLKKLDPITRSEYMEARKAPRDLATFEEFMLFLESKFTALEPIYDKNKQEGIFSKPSYRNRERPTFGAGKNPVQKLSYTISNNYNCVLCHNNNHSFYQCRKFDAMTPDMKLKTVTKHRLCKNCLFAHEYNICKSNKRCKICNKQHNTLLHEAFVAMEPSTSRQHQNSRQQNTNYVKSDENEILLTTVKIRVQKNDKQYITLRALLDQGSQTTLITENAAQRLGLPRYQFNASVSGVGTTTRKSKGKLELTCQSIHDDYSFMTEALIMPKLINNLPNSTIAKKSYSHLQHIQLADPEYYTSKPIDILLDAKVYSDIIMSGLIKGSDQQPIAQQTKLGWILSGNVTHTLNCNVVINNIDDIANYWEMEDIFTDTLNLTTEEQFCEQLYVSTTNRTPDGRYEVRLPMKQNFEKQLGQSKSRALAQFKQLEHRLMKDDTLYHRYQHFMNEYITLGHMKECTTKQIPMCYLPHHGVIKEDSITTKLRTVFNASNPTTSGYSLNDLMECGPKLQQDIQDLLLRWRTYQFVYTADCEKMYRCILIQEDQQHLQKIFWRNHPEDILKEYQLCTITYGMKAAPFLAMRTMKQLALDEANNYPLAANILQRDFYVDDLLTGSDSIEEAKEIQKQLIDMLRSAGINLRKWLSNSPELLSDLHQNQVHPTTMEFNHSAKTLGVRWNPITDTFSFCNNNKLQMSSKCTKRMLLSEISKLYDPLGWLSPLTIRYKLLFQQVWLEDIDWSDEVSENVQQQWNKFHPDLQHIDKLVIPRWIGDLRSSTEIHGFCDASERAYACIIYLKSIDDKGSPVTRIIAAKTKLAPRKKTITLPRLELCGALLLTKLIAKVKNALPRHDIPVYGWTDSLVVLGWLQGNPSRWKTFVANRTREITDIMPASSWRHISSQDNAADCATRGLTISQLIEHSLWWEGPACIKNDISLHSIKQVDMPQIEMKNIPTKQACASQLTYSVIEDLLNKNSSMTRIIRIVCYVSRFITNLRHRVPTRSSAPRCKQFDASGIVHNAPLCTNYLTANEIKHAYHLVIKAVQEQIFQDDISQIKKKSTVTSKSNILKLNPYLDEYGLLRVGGRLQHSILTNDAKHPIIIPKDSRLTELLIIQTHLQTLHGGPRLTMTVLRQKYWLIGGNTTVKKILRKCIKCYRYNHHKQVQLMSDLPEARVTPSRPFTHTGVDFTGQVELKANKGRGIKTCKGYIAVFVCFSTKAIHLELVSDLSSPSFLAAFKRLCARRGTPKEVYSDNGTNFVGAARILKREYQHMLEAIDKTFLSEVSQMGVTWHFNVPAWPSAGGLWEAAVKSTKHHLRRVLGEQKLTYEEFSTLLTQIEACLNSRPLYAISENAEDDFLTPGHFLIGGPVISPPSSDTDIKCIRTRWQLTEKMHYDFWKRWSTDYLQHLQLRSKWNHPKKNLEKNDIVFIKEDNLPPCKWALGRVTEIHPGKDGHVRAVTLKTKSGEIKRPIIKLAPLPLEKETVQNTVYNDNTDNSGTPRRQRRCRRSKTNIILSALLLLLTFIAPSIQEMINISAINNNNTLYFDKVSDVRIIQDQWKMVIYYNMTTYWQSIQTIEKYVQVAGHGCRNDSVCSPIISQFEHELNELRHYNGLLYSHSLRRRRGLINGVGYVANTLFGVLDDSFAQKYEKDIETIKKRENHIFNLYKNQTSILEAENNILKRNEQIMNKQFIAINSTLRSVITDIHAFDDTLSFISVDVIISNLRRIQEALIDTVTNIYHGRLNIHLLPPEQIKQQLNIISAQLQDDLIMPADNVRDLYGLLRVQAKITKKFLIMEVKIPLLNRDLYELDHIIDIPQRREINTVYTSTETKYLAINIKKDTMIPMSESDIQSCIHHVNNLQLCPLHHPMYRLTAGESICNIRITLNNENTRYCRSEVKTCTDRWIKLHSQDTWLFSCCTECNVRILCPADVTNQRLHGNGLMTLNQGCVVRGASFTILAQHNYATQLNMQLDVDIATPQISHLNGIINTTLSQDFTIENHDQQFEDIDQRIHLMKNQELEQFSRDDNNHYIIIYVVLVIMGIALVTITIPKCRRWYCRNRNSTAHRQQAQPQPLEASSSASIPLEELRIVAPVAKERRALGGSTASVDTATSPIPFRRISFSKV